MAAKTRANIYATLERASVVAEAYGAVADALERGSLSEAERVTVLLAASFENRCDYCIPVYTMLGRKAGMAPAVIDALRAGTGVPDERLDVVAGVTRALIQNHGRLSPELRRRFGEAGFAEEQLLEVVLGIAQKTITNYANHLFHPPLDAMFEPARWSPPSGR
jgi:AhpD family alkylhydroperoxidase